MDSRPLNAGRLDPRVAFWSAHTIGRPLSAGRTRSTVRPGRPRDAGVPGAEDPHQAIRRAAESLTDAAACGEGDATTARIELQRDGLTAGWPSSPATSILAAASRAGMDVPYSCKSGVCAAAPKLLEGQVRMDRNFAARGRPPKAGFILTCQGAPADQARGGVLR